MAITPPLPCKRVANLECEWPNCECYPSETKLVETPIPVTAIWLRRIGDYAEVLFEQDGVWRFAIRETLDSNFSHIIEVGGMKKASQDTIAESGS